MDQHRRQAPVKRQVYYDWTVGYLVVDVTQCSVDEQRGAVIVGACNNQES
jgi:hypothetical protein